MARSSIVERHAAHVDALEQIGRRLAGADAALDQRGDLLRLRRGDGHAGAGIDVVGMNAQRLADQKGRLRDRIGGAVREDQLRPLQPPRGGADQFGNGRALRPGSGRPSPRRAGFALLQRRSATGAFSAARNRVTYFTGLAVTNAAILSSTTRPRLCEALRSSSSPFLPNATRPV